MDHTRIARVLRGDRIQWMAILVVACLVSVLLLKSQSRASYPTYALALVMVATIPRWKDVFQISIVRWVAALLVWLSLSTAWSEAFALRDAISTWVRALLVFAFVVAVAECQLRGQVQRWMARALTLAGVVVVVLAIVNFYVTDPDDGRLNGLGQLDTHVIAALVYGVVGIFVAQLYLSTPNRPARMGCAVALGLIVVAIWLSDSRNAWVSVPLGLCAYALANRVKDARQFSVAMVALLGSVALIGGIVLLDPEFREAVLPRGTSFRPEIWSHVIDRLQGSWFAGRGVLSDSELMINGLTFDHAHNMYLAVVEQGGLVGLGLYLIVLGKALSVLVRNYSHQDAKFALAVFALGLSAHLLDGHELLDKVGASWFLIWLPVALATGFAWQQGNRP